MTKTKIICSAIMIATNLENVQAMLVPVNGNRSVSLPQSYHAGRITVASFTPDTVVKIVPKWRYDFFEFSEDETQVILHFTKGYFEDVEIFREIGYIEKMYPYEKVFLNLEPATANSSYGVYQLFANTEELGRLLVSDHYVDRDNALLHRTKIVNSKLITYVTDRDNVERQISCVPHQPKRPKVHMYVRSGGHEIRGRWQGITMKIKPDASRPLHKNEILQIFMAERFNLPYVLHWEYRLNRQDIQNVQMIEQVLRKYHIDIFRLMQILYDCLAKYMSPNK